MPLRRRCAETSGRYSGTQRVGGGLYSGELCQHGPFGSGRPSQGDRRRSVPLGVHIDGGDDCDVDEACWMDGEPSGQQEVGERWRVAGCRGC